MIDAGLVTRHDALGNIYGRLEGRDSTAGVVGSGSHIDAIPLSGMYDGVYGVLGAIAALRALRIAGFAPTRSLEAILFTSEEPTRFGISCLGSRAMAGVLPAAALTDIRDAGGASVLEAAAGAGYRSASPDAALADVRRNVADVAYFVELHIEQGPRLEAAGKDVGIVTAIAAPAALNVTFTGGGGHAGAQLMPLRNDASLAAAEAALALERHVLSLGGAETVGTAGAWDIGPNAINSVPRRAVLGVDVRDTVRARRDAVLTAFEASASEIAARRGVELEVAYLSRDPPATCSDEVRAAAARAAASLVPGLSTMALPSHAYHDSLFMAQIARTGMLFIPCHRGYSHRPDEFASGEAMARGARALALTLAALAGSEGGAPGGDGSQVEL